MEDLLDDPVIKPSCGTFAVFDDEKFIKEDELSWDPIAIEMLVALWVLGVADIEEELPKLI
jgi:hypothetical protein